ncbi:MAG: hypothetical protein AAF495_08640 [Pseudomonadota bacterium]
MIDLSTLLDRASELLASTDVSELTQNVGATELLEQTGIDPADIAGLSDRGDGDLLSEVGLDVKGLAEGLVKDP